MSHPLSSNFLQCFIINRVSSSQLPQSIDLIGLTAAVLELEYACFSGVEALMISRLDPDELSSGESTIPEEVSGIDEYDAALCYVLPFFLGEFPQKMLRNVLSHLTHLEVSLEFPDTLKSTGGLY